MSREQRKQVLRARNQASDFEPIDVFSEEAVRLLEEMERSSESRFDALRSPEAVTKIAHATGSFRRDRRFKIAVTDSAEEIPDIPQGACFKYSHSWDGGSLIACSQRIRDGEKMTMVLVREDGFLIGYGIAVTRETESEIEIIDVDYYSRRKAGLKETVLVGTKSFDVGVGHVLVMALMGVCPRPVGVDATTPDSRYVFKSLGFIHDSGTSNPCILRME
jgi:hypothetical protein